MLGLKLGLSPKKGANQRALSDALAGAVFDLDATMLASYGGTGQVLANLITAPADASPRSAYDMVLGATNAVATDDPTFTGSAGNKDAYFLCDGGDQLRIPTSTTWINQLYNTTVGNKITLIAVFEYAGIGGTQQYLFGNTYLANYPGWRVQISTTGQVQLIIADGSSSYIGNGPTLTAGMRYLICITLDNTTKAWKLGVNSRTFNFTGTATSANNTTDNTKQLTLGAGGGGNPVISGTKLISFAALTGYTPSDTDLAKIINFYNARHKRTYA